jgi:AraC-like DNA-binding protein
VAADGYAVAAPVTELVERSGLPERTFKRRFARATGVGYEDPASFRLLFKRITGVSPGAYRRKLQLPAFARVRTHRQQERHARDRGSLDG